MRYIHKEGRVLVYTSLFILIAIGYWLYASFSEVIFASVFGALFLFWLAVASFFRNPKRTVSAVDGEIIAPCDGKVVVIEEVEEPEYFKDKRIQVSIFMSPANVHVNRVPWTGVVKYAKYHAGKFLVAWHPKSSTENERTTVVFEHQGKEILLRQIAGALARRIKYYVKPGDKVRQGEDYGFIKFGSRVDLFLPLDAKINVNLNQKAVGNKTVIAKV